MIKGNTNNAKCTNPIINLDPYQNPVTHSALTESLDYGLTQNLTEPVPRGSQTTLNELRFLDSNDSNTNFELRNYLGYTNTVSFHEGREANFIAEHGFSLSTFSDSYLF